MSQLRPLWAAALLCLSLIGCSSSPNHGPSLGLGDAGDSKPPPTVGACETPAEGCECTVPKQDVDCGQVERVSGDYVSCSMGHRTCDDGKWGACIGDSVSTLHVPAAQRRTQALGTGMDCTTANPCDPYCRLVADNPTNLPLPDGGPFTNDGGLQIAPHDQTTGMSSCTSMTVTPSPQALTVTGFGGRGVLGEYFNHLDQTLPQIPTAWAPTATRIDPNLSFDWGGSGDPMLAGMPNQNFSVRWTGSIVAPTTQAYTLCVQSDDGNRVWIDGNLISDVWYEHMAQENCSGALNWAAGSTHAVRFEFFQTAGGAGGQLTWSAPTIAKQVIPQSAFALLGSSTPTVTGSAKFGISLSPAGCFPGTPQPAWTLDRLDIATIDTTGQVSLISAVAGPITVSAYLGTLNASGVVNVKVDVAANDAAPTGSVTAFQTATSGTDTAQILYPYDQTVLPIGLQAPVIQWDNKGTAASAVRVTLRYPSTGAPTFRWAQIIPESNPPQATITSEAWKVFQQTAKGQTAVFSVQRLIGAQPRPALTHTLTFSSSPVRGKIYFTQYHRLSNDANEMVADPGSANVAQPAFGSTDGCPVCHTVSANGKVFATSSKTGYEGGDQSSNIKGYSGTLGGISSINTNGQLTQIADFPGTPSRLNYIANTEDWRGFAWSPLSPDGKYALVANDIWGNTQQNLIGIDGGSRQVNTGNVMQSGGSGIGLLAQYYPSLNYTGQVWKRIDPQVNFDIAGSPGGLIGANFSVKRTGQIQAYFSETYKFEVLSTSTDAFVLTVGASTASGTGPTTVVANVPMTAGAIVPFELDQINNAGNSDVQLFWSSPSTPRALVPQSQLFPPAAEPAHGANVKYTSGATNASLIEPDIASNWALHAPVPGYPVDNWNSTWDAQVESPYTGAIALCVDSDDGVTLSIDGGPLLINSPGTGTYSGCTANQAWTAGAKHLVHIVHNEIGSNAYVILKYKYSTVTEVIPTTNLYPQTNPAPTSGLTATYYDIDGFNAALPATQTNPRAFQRVDPNIDFDWSDGRPNYSVISADDTYSARWTGHIILPCDGVYQFQTNGNVDDGGRLWIDSNRIMGRWSYGALAGSAYLKAGTHDFKFDWFENGGSAVARLQWNTPCAGSPGWVSIPTGAFTPNASYTRPTGFVVDGGDNGNNSSYWVWQTPTSAAPTPIDVTAPTTGNWGIAGAAMMVPSFSPDSTKLVFIDGDSADGAGWRKGLSTYDFDQTGKVFKNRHLITSTWPLGDVMKWPTFESDSRSVIFQTSVPGDACCRKPSAPPAQPWTRYGYMGPTNYYEDPGRLWSVDSQSTTPAPVLLTKLNSGEQAKDANKSYQATMLPVAAGGYRWVVFTSTRPYGNTLNLPTVQQDFSNTASYPTAGYSAITNYTDIQGQLWVAAIDDSPSAGVDRSHPGFWLPSQNFSPQSGASTGYVNERGYWVLNDCHPPGTTSASSCDVDEDCCGGSGTTKTAACRLDSPITNPPTRHCQAIPAGCATANNSCGGPADCCSGLVCVGAVCSTPPTVLTVNPQNYERIYTSDCPDGTKVVWRFFDWKTITPPTGSKLEFYAETQADQTMFSTLPTAPDPVITDGVVSVGTASGAPVTVFTGNSVDLLLAAKMLKSQQYLKVTIRFIPNAERTASPILTDWRQSYSCLPAE